MQTGSYSLDACVVVQHRHLLLNGRYKIGLLTRPPTPEGAHAIELAAPGYVVQDIRFGLPPLVGGVVRSVGRLSFGPIADEVADVRHAAIYDEAHAVIAYGLLRRAPGYVGPREIAFESEAIQVRF
jgi:hypothetical protein